MPRGKRLIRNNICYHIVNRGNQKQRIFLENSDFEEFLKLLKHYKRKFTFNLFGYCLMPNHIHLIIEPREGNQLSKFMQGLSQTYTIWFNKKYIKVGRLWQGRFKSKLIQKDQYLVDCIYYIETNPVRAGLVGSPANYFWSSYKERVLNSTNGLLDFPDST